MHDSGDDGNTRSTSVYGLKLPSPVGKSPIQSTLLKHPSAVIAVVAYVGFTALSINKEPANCYRAASLISC
jgi:hypothetical protein